MVISGRLHSKYFLNMVELNFKIGACSHKWLLRYSTINILRSSSIGGRLHFKDV